MAAAQGAGQQEGVSTPAWVRCNRTMKFSKLRLSGFKSFVEPTELVIKPGLTGVVGPNGCGKSNLLEALRWVMGESSYKSMRGSGMDDVIFSGTSNRPSRNMAEVTLTLDNDDRTRAARLQRIRPAGDLAPHRARGRLGLPDQRQGRARPRRAAAVRRRLDGRALAGAGAAGPDRRDHQRPSRRRAGASWKKPPALPACIPAATRPSCGCARPRPISSGSTTCWPSSKASWKA